jgi:hypothetical protein
MANTFNHNDKVVITDGGSVGIGTTSPDERLHVVGAIKASRTTGASENTFIYSQQTAKWGSSTYPGIIESVGNNSFLIGSSQNIPLHLTRSGAIALTIGTGGNVGIGTTSPSKQLEILYPSYIDKDTVQGLIRLTGQSNTENSGDIPSAGVGIEFYNKWSGGAPYSIGRISARGSQSYDGGLQFDVAQNSAPGQSNFTTAMTILDTGNVGIGTTSPSHKLQVEDGNIGLYSDSYGNTGMIRFFGTNNSEKLQIGSLSTNGFLFSPDGIGLSIYTGGSENVRITSAGNVGIGTTSPNASLHIEKAGDQSSSVKGITLSSGAAGTNKYLPSIVWSYGANGTPDFAKIESQRSLGTGARILFSTANTSGTMSEAMRIDESGKVGIGNASPVYKIHAKTSDATWGYRFENNTGVEDVHTFLSHGGGYGIAVDSTSNSSSTYLMKLAGGTGGTGFGSVERFRVTSSGNVGIGTTSPAYKLEVSGGAISIKGNAAGNSLRFDDSGGTSRNAMYVDTSNYLNVGNANYAGIKFYHTATAPTANSLEGNQIAEGYGTTDEGKVLADPDAWLAVRVGTTDYAIPMYTTG